MPPLHGEWSPFMLIKKTAPALCTVHVPAFICCYLWWVHIFLDSLSQTGKWLMITIFTQGSNAYLKFMYCTAGYFADTKFSKSLKFLPEWKFCNFYFCNLLVGQQLRLRAWMFVGINFHELQSFVSGKIFPLYIYGFLLTLKPTWCM